jgi:hypothetical protein
MKFSLIHLDFFSHHTGAGHHLGVRRDFDVRAFLPATSVTSDSSTTSALMFAHAGEKTGAIFTKLFYANS